MPRATLPFKVVSVRFAKTTADARLALRRILEGDVYERMTVHAFCAAVDTLSDYYYSAPNAYYTQVQWRSIIYSFITNNVSNWTLPRTVQVINGWTNIWNMALINPRLAYFYLRACY